MGSPTEQSESPPERHPLAGIGLIAIVMVILTAVLYSVSPVGPMREGDVVFADGRQRVYLATPARYREAGYETHCYLEPREALVVLERPLDRPDGTLKARFEGKSRLEFPFCPPQAEVLVKPHQVVQKVGLWEELKARLAGLIQP